MIWKYPDTVKKFISENVSGRTTKELAELTNNLFGTAFTESSMKSYKSNHKLKSGTRCGIAAGLPTRTFPDNIRRFINENYVGTGHKAMADLLNETFQTNYTKDQIKGYYSHYKLNSGLNRYYPKGHVPANKGTHSGGWEPTQFKKGHRPANWVPIGSERVNADGYIDIKVADGQKQKKLESKTYSSMGGA